MTVKVFSYGQQGKSSFKSFNQSKIIHNITFQIAYCFTHFIISYYALGFLYWPNSLNFISKDQQISAPLVGLFYYLSSSSYINATIEWGFIFLTLKYFPSFTPGALFIASLIESFEFFVYYQLLEPNNNEPVSYRDTNRIDYNSLDNISDVDSETTLGSPNLEHARLKELPIPNSTPKVIEIIKVSVIERQRWYPIRGWIGEMFGKDPLPFSVSEPNPLSLPNLSPMSLKLPKPKAPEKHPDYPIQTILLWLWAPLNSPKLSNSSTDPQFEIEDDWTFYKAGWKDPQKYSDFGCVVRSRTWSCNLIKIEIEDYYYEVEHCTPFKLNKY